MKVTLFKDKETRNTIRFKENQLDDVEPVVGIIYIPKRTLQDIGYKDGDAIVVQVEVAI